MRGAPREATRLKKSPSRCLEALWRSSLEARKGEEKNAAGKTL